MSNELEIKNKMLMEQIKIYKEMEKLYIEKIAERDETIKKISERENVLREKLRRIYGEVKEF